MNCHIISPSLNREILLFCGSFILIYFPSWILMAYKYPFPESSIICCKYLADFIQQNSSKMVRSCDNYFLYKREYYIYIRSSCCAECLCRGSYYNIRIIYCEFERLQKERDILIEHIERNRATVSAALEEQKKLNKSLRDIERREAEAIAMEEANILKSENQGNSPEIALSPLTWSASAGFPNGFWDNSIAELGD